MLAKPTRSWRKSSRDYSAGAKSTVARNGWKCIEKDVRRIVVVTSALELTTVVILTLIELDWNFRHARHMVQKGSDLLWPKHIIGTYSSGISNHCYA